MSEVDGVVEMRKQPTYTILVCPHCGKYIGADCFRLQDLNKANRARFLAAEKRVGGKK